MGKKDEQRFANLCDIFQDYFRDLTTFGLYKNQFLDSEGNPAKPLSEQEILDYVKLLNIVTGKHKAIFDLIEAFNRPRGEGYEMSKHLLEHYREYKFTLSSFIAVGDTCFETIRIKDEYGKLVAESLRESQSPQGDSTSEFFVELTDYFINYNFQELQCSKNLTSLANSDKTRFVAPLLTIVERIIKKMKASPDDKVKTQGKILFEYYLSAKNAGKDIEFVASELEMATRTFQRWKTDAIITFSEFFWGVDCVKNSLTNIAVDTEKNRLTFILNK